MKTIAARKERFSLPVFLILVPLFSFVIALFLPLPVEITPLAMVFVPALLAVILVALTGGSNAVGALLKKLLRWRVGFKWYILATGLALGVRLAMSLLALLFGWIPAIRLNDWSTPQFVIIGLFIVIGAIMEELGWRGFALPRLLSGRPALASALFSGLIWGTTHLALTLPGQMNAGSYWLLTILYIAALSVILTWFYLQTQGSLAIPILYHVGQSFFVLLNGGISLTQQLWLLTGVTLVLALILSLIYGASLQHGLINQQGIANTRQAETS